MKIVKLRAKQLTKKHTTQTNKLSVKLVREAVKRGNEALPPPFRA